MNVNIKYELKTDDGKIILGCEGNTDLDVEKLKKVNIMCFDYGYSLNSLINFFIENIKLEDVEDLLATMDHCTPRTSE